MAFEQDPDGRERYPVSWAGYLAGDTLADSVWISNDPGILICEDDSFTSNASEVFIRFVGPVTGEKYSATNRITSVDGRKNDHTIVIKIKES
jgi:hypothetical protein